MAHYAQERCGRNGGRLKAKTLALNEAILLKFFAQSSAVDAENFRCNCLISIGIFHDAGKQWSFDFAQHQVVKISRLVSVKIFEVSAERFFCERSQRAVSQLNFGEF